MRIAILGSKGLIGREFSKLDECLPFTHNDCDITDFDSLQQMFRCNPDAVVNCAGIVRSRIGDFRPSEVVDINSYAPHVIGEECYKRKIRFIQISTDCVFDGRFGTEYTEASQPTPDDFYAVTKLAGEVRMFGQTTIRTSFVGPDGGLLEWARSQKNIIGYDLEYWNGLSTKYVAQWVVDYLHTDFNHFLIHLGGRVYTKYEVLTMANEIFGWGLKIKCGPTPSNRWRRRILKSNFIESIDIPLEQMLEAMK